MMDRPGTRASDPGVKSVTPAIRREKDKVGAPVHRRDPGRVMIETP